MSETKGYTYTVYAESLNEEQRAFMDNMLLAVCSLFCEYVTKEEDIHYLGYVQDNDEVVEPWGLEGLEKENFDEQVE